MTGFAGGFYVKPWRSWSNLSCHKPLVVIADFFSTRRRKLLHDQTGKLHCRILIRQIAVNFPSAKKLCQSAKGMENNVAKNLAIAVRHFFVVLTKRIPRGISVRINNSQIFQRPCQIVSRKYIRLHNKGKKCFRDISGND